MIFSDNNSNFNNLMCLTAEQRTVFDQHYTYFSTQNKEFGLNADDVIGVDFENFSFVKQSLVYVITESVSEYPHILFTEKTWKAFVYRMPFMMIGAKNSLQKLRSFGFETFRDFWNEDYDTLENSADRIDAVIENLVNLNTLSSKEIDNLQQKMLPIVEHNYYQLIDFKNQQISSLRENV